MAQTTGERGEATDGPVAVLVGCGKAKHDGTLPAKDKYSSNYFGLKREYAEEVGDAWAIISAEYGVVEPDEEIDDYDTTVRDMRADERALWGETTGHNIVKWLSELEKTEGYPSEVHLLLGTAYQEPLADTIRFLEESTDVDVVRPFDDTSGIGEQMSKLKMKIEYARHEEGEA